MDLQDRNRYVETNHFYNKELRHQQFFVSSDACSKCHYSTICLLTSFILLFSSLKAQGVTALPTHTYVYCTYVRVVKIFNFASSSIFNLISPI